MTYLRILLPLLLILSSNLLRADSYPATQQFIDNWWGVLGPSKSALCSAHAGYRLCDSCSSGIQSCGCTNGNSGSGCSASFSISRNSSTCPYGGTLSADFLTCVNAPSCDPPKVRNQTTGVCENPPSKCEASAGQVSAAWYVFDVGADPNGAYCVNGCQVQMQADSAQQFYYTNGKKNRVRMQSLTINAECTNGRALPTPSSATESPPIPPKEPECSPGEGVLTSSTGKVHCVPAGVPDAPKPKVEKKSDVQNFPDGSKKTTDITTTTDPETGVTDTRIRTETSPKPDGTPGQAGPPGIGGGKSSSSTSSNGSGTPDGSGNSDLCSKNPGLQICKGGMNEEKTQIEVRDELKKLTNPGDTSTDPLKNATHTSESENRLKTENDKFTDAVKGVTDATSASKSSWQQAMESGWFSAVPSSGCSPITGTVGSRTFTWDHCEKAAQIASIMSYALWFMLIVGAFVMFTGGQRTA